jgi:MFS transporter, MFS domain-containing protein family, molybdate-anion transporter
MDVMTCSEDFTLTRSGMYAAGDWLQGPYVYALYEYYGYQVGDIGRLFIAGFGSSMIFGTLAGSLADKQCASLAFRC